MTFRDLAARSGEWSKGYLYRCDHAARSGEWSKAISTDVTILVSGRPGLLLTLGTLDTTHSEDSICLVTTDPLLDILWLSLVALIVYGGHIDSIRVGTRVHLSFNESQVMAMISSILAETTASMVDESRLLVRKTRSTMSHLAKSHESVSRWYP
jgi:fumarate reductase subunit D